MAYSYHMMHEWQIPAVADFLQYPVVEVQKHWDDAVARNELCIFEMDKPLPEIKICPNCRVLVRLETMMCKTEKCGFTWKT